MICTDTDWLVAYLQSDFEADIEEFLKVSFQKEEKVQNGLTYLSPLTRFLHNRATVILSLYQSMFLVRRESGIYRDLLASCKRV